MWQDATAASAGEDSDWRQKDFMIWMQLWWFPPPPPHTSLECTRKNAFTKKKDDVANAPKKLIFTQSLSEYRSKILKLNHVFVSFAKGTPHILNLHTNYCVSLSRGQQPMNRNLPWGVWCTHRRRPLLSLVLCLSFPLWSYWQPSDIPVHGCYESPDSYNGWLYDMRHGCR